MYHPKIFVIIAFALSFLVSQDKNRPIAEDVYFQIWMNDPLLKNSAVSFSVVDANSGQCIYESAPQLSLVPASVMKIVTTAAALDLLGPDYRFETRLGINGSIDNSGILHGDLIIAGGGDPALGSAYFSKHYLATHFIDEWVNALYEKGIREITGDLIADASIYEQQMIPNTWIWEDLGNYYGAGACGLSVYDNLYEISLKSGEAGQACKIIKINPEVPGLEITSEVVASESKRDMAFVFGSPYDNKRIIRGTIPTNQKDFRIKASMPDPPLLLATQLKDKLKEKGIEQKGKIRTMYLPSEMSQTIHQIWSPPLSEIVKVLNHESVNLFAEHLCKHLAWQKTGKGNTRAGLDIMLEYWKNKGIDTNGMFLADGSGLSRFNAITAKQLTSILQYIHQSQYAELFKLSLPSVEENGTLKVFNAKIFPGETLRAKSGSMTRVRSYAGFLKTHTGNELIFSIILNNYSCSSSQTIRKIEELLGHLR